MYDAIADPKTGYEEDKDGVYSEIKIPPTNPCVGGQMKGFSMNECAAYVTKGGDSQPPALYEVVDLTSQV